ncbi:FG-GAP-like repeat-containing protein [Paenarthrobacter aromaticivorans]|uniref:FG-GAP-like repeat-containing protein n=1 Tax=Paenarthrobacter aromaticivorans TaxID=2849150 RepID=UPI003A810CA2
MTTLPFSTHEHLRARSKGLLRTLSATLLAVSLTAAALFGMASPAQADVRIADIVTGSAPTETVVNPVTNRIYVANHGSPFLTAVDGATNAASSIQLAGRASGLAVNAVTNTVYASVDGTIVAIDGASKAVSVVHSGPVGGELAVNETTNQIFAVNQTGMLIIDGDTKVAVTVPLDGYASRMAVNSATNTVYAIGWYENAVFAVNATTKNSTKIAVGERPIQVAVNKKSNKVYVTAESVTETSIPGVTVIDGATNATTSIPFYDYTGALAVNEKTNKVYVSTGAYYLSELDGATNKVRKFEYGDFLDSPVSLVVNETTNKVYGVIPNRGKLIVLRASTGVFEIIQVGNWPQVAAVNEVTNKTYVANQSGGALSVIDGADAPPAFTAGQPPAVGTVGSAYNYTFQAKGSPAPKFSVYAGTLPPGLVLNKETGLLSGIANKAGTYKVQVAATNGVSPSAFTKWFSITVNPAKNDFTSDGKADTLARDAAGTLWLYPGDTGGHFLPRIQVGSGWNVMTSLVAPGDLNGDGKADVLARDTAGVLWLYPGNGYGEWFPRLQVGAGWNVMTSIVGPGDFNGDGKHDILARDSAGVLWLYPGNGTGGWLARTPVGSGWNAMDKIVGPGDFNGDGNHDVIASDSAGALWLYPGNGRGGWLPRVQVGSGWDYMTGVVGPGDFNSNFQPDGTADLLARDKDGILWHYPGDGRGGWLPRFAVGWGWDVMTAVL